MTLRTLLGLILGLIFVGVIIFGIVTFVRTRFLSVQKNVPKASPTDIMVSSPATASASIFRTDSNIGNTVDGSVKVFHSGNVPFRYPLTWGLLTCTNSLNFEFDPTNANDQKQVCDRALKPITVLVNNNQGCGGEKITLNGLVVTKSRVENVRGVDYRWCFSTEGRSFNVTHRVSGTAGRGLSKDDFSKQIEGVIGNILFSGGS